MAKKTLVAVAEMLRMHHLDDFEGEVLGVNRAGLPSIRAARRTLSALPHTVWCFAWVTSVGSLFFIVLMVGV